MPRFAANLAYLFTERPLIERFAAAAAAGFTAVELQFPYDHAPSAIKAELAEARADPARRQHAAAAGAGDVGLAAVPGRERDWEAVFGQALDTVVAIGGSAIHCIDRHGAARAAAGGGAHHHRQHHARRRSGARKEHHLLLEPINPRDRPDYFLTRVEQAADMIAKVGKPNVRIQYDFYHVQIVSGDLLKRFEQHLPLIGHVQIAAVPSRAEPDEGEIELLERLCGARPARLVGLGRRANTARAAAPRTGSAGGGRSGSPARDRDDS